MTITITAFANSLDQGMGLARDMIVRWALAEVALYLAICHHKAEPVEIIPCITKSLPFLAGVIVLVKARSLAEWISDKLDL